MLRYTVTVFITKDSNQFQILKLECECVQWKHANAIQNSFPLLHLCKWHTISINGLITSFKFVYNKK